MANALTPSVEAFVDRVAADRHFLRVGYRTEGTDRILSAVDLPVHVLEEEVASGLQLITTVSLSGEVTSQIVGSSGLALLSPRTISSIHDLVSQAVSTDNLRLEEASTNELCDLLRNLEAALDHVRTALAQTRSGV
jgi:hypothetical protein